MWLPKTNDCDKVFLTSHSRVLGSLHIPVAKRPGFDADPSVLRPHIPWSSYETAYDTQYHPQYSLLERERSKGYYGYGHEPQFAQVNTQKKPSIRFYYKYQFTHLVVRQMCESTTNYTFRLNNVANELVNYYRVIIRNIYFHALQR